MSCSGDGTRRLVQLLADNDRYSDQRLVPDHARRRGRHSGADIVHELPRVLQRCRPSGASVDQATIVGLYVPGISSARPWLHVDTGTQLLDWIEKERSGN